MAGTSVAAAHVAGAAALILGSYSHITGEQVRDVLVRSARLSHADPESSGDHRTLDVQAALQLAALEFAEFGVVSKRLDDGCVVPTTDRRRRQHRVVDHDTRTPPERLSDIHGIGKQSESRLHAAGIDRFQDLEVHSAEQLALITSISPLRIIGQDWIGQARRLNRKRNTVENRRRASKSAHAEGQSRGQAADVSPVSTLQTTKSRRHQ
jgi:predicted flap endonuclease-1-like 5' DNA nuclease